MNKKSTKKEPIKSNRVFYVALYSCMGVLLLLAAVVSFNNYNAASRDKEKLMAEQAASNQVQAANASTVKSYLTPSDRGESAVKPTDQLPQQNATPEAKPAVSPQATQAPVSAPRAPKAPVRVTEENSNAEKDATSLSEPIFDEFADGDTLSWPVLGEVVMDYSTDHVVYDKTLEQYRTNDSLCISSEIGTPVQAAASGVVSLVEKTRMGGNTVTIDHGNGYSTTYCQLQDGVLVNEGDIVSTGQVIGGVGSPSIYSVLLGNHVEFSVALNDETIDPKHYLNN